MLDRLDRLERDINLLQRQVYRGTGPGGAPVAVSPSDNQTAVNVELRMTQIEDQMRAITGQIEEVGNNLEQVKRRLDKLATDVDQRLSQLEHAPPAPAAAPVAGGGQAGDTAAAAGRAESQTAARPPGAGADPGAPASRSGVLGTLPAASPPEQTAAAPAAAASGSLPNGTPQEQYNYAFGLLRQANTTNNYAPAEQALRAFVERNPNDQLAGNAQYWLGETYYVRKDYNSAAIAFAEGYQKYPKSTKAADDLLKLAMSLGNLGQKADACRAFARLDRDFPSPGSAIKEREGDEKKKIGC